MVYTLSIFFDGKQTTKDYLFYALKQLHKQGCHLIHLKRVFALFHSGSAQKLWLIKRKLLLFIKSPNFVFFTLLMSHLNLKANSITAKRVQNSRTSVMEPN